VAMKNIRALYSHVSETEFQEYATRISKGMRHPTLRREIHNIKNIRV